MVFGAVLAFFPSCFWFDVAAKHNTHIATETSQNEGEQLIAMFSEKCPETDTAGRTVISATEYDKMRVGA